MKIHYLFPATLCLMLSGCVEHDYPNSHYGVDKNGDPVTSCKKHDTDPKSEWHDKYYTGNCEASDKCRWHNGYRDADGFPHPGYYEGDCGSDGDTAHFQDNISEPVKK